MCNNKILTDCLNKDDILHIWTFGCVPGTSLLTNVLCDQTKGVQLVKEIKSDVVNGFSDSTMHGVLCHEQVRGVKFNILDAKIHSDKVHRNAGAVIPMTRRCSSGEKITPLNNESSIWLKKKRLLKLTQNNYHDLSSWVMGLSQI